jgi:hypothetical protein
MEKNTRREMNSFRRIFGDFEGKFAVFVLFSASKKKFHDGTRRFPPLKRLQKIPRTQRKVLNLFFP